MRGIPVAMTGAVKERSPSSAMMVQQSAIISSSGRFPHAAHGIFLRNDGGERLSRMVSLHAGQERKSSSRCWIISAALSRQEPPQTGHLIILIVVWLS
jgi:hypothetical protein